jgi:hypothetical protein
MEIFLYSIEGHQMKSGQLASVCRSWRSAVTGIASLWSTLRVGPGTEREQVTTWLQRAYPLKIIIDTQRDGQTPSTPALFYVLQDALNSTDQWNDLTMLSFPPDNMAGQLDFQVAKPMSVLKALHMAAGCAHSASLASLLELVPNDAPLSDLRLYPTFATAHFLQPPWFPVLKNLTVLIVNGRGVHEPFHLLPDFTQLQIFEAHHLPLPLYDLNVALPLLTTLRKLHLQASSVQWMAGREFPSLEECAILLPQRWRSVQEHAVELPSCRKLTYYGYPMTMVQSLHAPRVSAISLGSNDCDKQRVAQHLHFLCRLDGRISQLQTLHLTLQCSEQAIVQVLAYMGPLEELVLSIAYPSSWENFFALLAAEPCNKDWPKWYTYQGDWVKEWRNWCSTQIWRANVLPSLKYLGIQCPKGFSSLSNCPSLRLIAWTRVYLGSPLEHLKVWEGRGTNTDLAEDYVSTSYLYEHFGAYQKELEWVIHEYDLTIIRGMVTHSLAMSSSTTQLLKPIHSTVLFKQLQVLEIVGNQNDHINILPHLEQIKELCILQSGIPAYPLDTDLPLVRTLHRLELCQSTFSWMLGRAFKRLKTFISQDLRIAAADLSRCKGLLVHLPACKLLQWDYSSVMPFTFISSPMIQVLQWSDVGYRNGAVLQPLHDFLLNSSCLRELKLSIFHHIALDSLIHFIFCESREQGVWKGIKSVEVKARFGADAKDQVVDEFFNQMIEHKQHSQKWWKEFTVDDISSSVGLRASI